MLSFLILFSMFVLSSVISITAAIMVVWSMFYGICEVYQFKKGEKWPMLMLVGIAFSSSRPISSSPSSPCPPWSSATTPTSPAAATSTSSAGIHLDADYRLDHHRHLLLVMKFVFKPDVSKIKNSTPPLWARKLTLSALHPHLLHLLHCGGAAAQHPARGLRADHPAQ